jgi:hypothetical protein
MLDTARFDEYPGLAERPAARRLSFEELTRQVVADIPVSEARIDAVLAATRRTREELDAAVADLRQQRGGNPRQARRARQDQKVGGGSPEPAPHPAGSAAGSAAPYPCSCPATT